MLVVPVSTRFKAPEIAHLLSVSCARLLLQATRFRDQVCTPVAQGLLAEVPSLQRVPGIGNLFELMAFADATPPSPFEFVAQPSDQQVRS